jgi:hypothetical protein
MGGVALVWPCLACDKVDKDVKVKIMIAGVLYIAILGLLYAWMPVFSNR